MKKLRQRFRKALFAFFKEEILECVKPESSYREVQFVHHEYNIHEIKGHIEMDSLAESFYGMPASVVYEKALERGKQELFNKGMKFIQINEHSVVERSIYPRRAIELSLLLAVKK